MKRFYFLIIIISIIFGMIYINYSLKKNGIKDKRVKYFYLIYIMFSLILGKIYNSIIYLNFNILKSGFSAYGGLIGVVVGAFIFEYILPTNKKVIKYSILSLPLVYGLSKIACHVAGCCYGIPYNGVFSIISHEVNESLFPIQIVESFLFILLFLICNKFKNNNNISYLTFCLTIILKFFLDFLRYDHVKVLLTPNQVFSIILIISICIYYFYIKKKKKV